MTKQQLIDAIEKAYAGQFMGPDLYYDTYYLVETTYGDSIVPSDVVGKVRPGSSKRTLAAVAYYVDGEPKNVIRCKGWMHMLTASGYMDCTDWCAHETEIGALECILAQAD